MLDSNQTANFLNPDTYLNHLSPAEGLEYQIRNNFTMLFLGAAVWDVLAYLPVDASIVRGSRFSFNIFCFIFSRLCTLCFVFLSTIRIPANQISPRVLYISLGCLCVLSLATSSFLFLQRALAIYHGNKRVRRGFFILWIVTSLSQIVIPVGGRSQVVPGTTINRNTDIDPWVTISVWSSFAFDTTVFSAISYKLWIAHKLPNEGSSWYCLVSGRTLPQLPRLIFRGGLQYYLIVIWSVMVTGIILCMPSVSRNYKTLFPVIAAHLIASMASRVFRNVKLYDPDHCLTEFTPVIE